MNGIDRWIRRDLRRERLPRIRIIMDLAWLRKWQSKDKAVFIRLW